MSGEPKYYPRFAVWELTNRCNARCIHCGSESGNCRENELTESEALHLCEELAELGCKQVGIIGGEFFLSPYWESVTKKLKELGVGVTHLTNGLLLNDKNIAKLKDLGVTWISISIDGIGETHDYLRGVPGLFDIAIENLKKAREEGFRVGINTAMSKRNIAELPQIFELLCELGVNSWQLQGVEDVGRANQNPELYLTVAEYYDIVKQVAEFRQKSSMYVCLGDNIGHFTTFEPSVRNNPFGGCIAGRLNVGIESNGNIRGCLSIRGDENVEGNIRQSSLKEIWNAPDAFKVFRNKSMEMMDGFCGECQYAILCRGGCSSLAYSVTGTFYDNPMCLHKYEFDQGICPKK